ncbi:Cysteine-type peptidase [Zea mays]|uniref:Cysteine-type peptidase n=1 Tax=Zea mays TaxID=4577 RepID=A0A1D6GCR9_MAIZE|nr:Cysteine-type peptidase [Zea mays]
MVLFELDPDIIRWGLHHLLPAPAGYSPHCRTQTTPTTPCTAFARPPHQPIGDMGTSSSVEIKVEHVDGVDNDAIIAQALQEELSNVAFAEASGPTSAADNQQHSAVLTQQWLRPRAVHVEPASQEAGTREEPFSTCSSPGDDNNVQDSQQCLIELMDNFSVIDGEVGKRLNNMVPVPVTCS